MKNIKFLSFLILSLFVFQTAIGQTDTDDKGRNKGANAGTPQVETPVLNVDAFSGSDQDIPSTGQAQPVASDWVLPNDLDALQDEMLSASSSPQAVVARLNELAEELALLRQYNEQLRLENRVIKRSLGSCCSDMGLSLNAADAYLMQNAPNPATDVSEIRFFVPNSASKAEIKISNVTGVVVETYPIAEGGFGAISLERGTYQNGTYIYSLEIDGELIDTKVMVFTK
ncbi:MAG: T9SS type A sorting domain-containing protein [Bacteroidota bacterium]